MSALIAWFSAARWRMTLGHVLLAVVMFASIALLFGHLVALGATIAWFWSREKAQYDMQTKSPGQSTATLAFSGLFPWSWTRWSALDFLAPSTITLILFILL